MKNKNLYLASLIILLIAAACVPGGGSSTSADPAGFLKGIWHGWIAPVSLVWGFFDHSVRVYEIHNTGWWYDFGFYIAIIGGFGGISLARKKSNKD